MVARIRWSACKGGTLLGGMLKLPEAQVKLRASPVDEILRQSVCLDFGGGTAAFQAPGDANYAGKGLCHLLKAARAASD